MRIRLISVIFLPALLLLHGKPVESQTPLRVIFLDAPWSNTNIYEESNCNGAAFLFNASEPLNDLGWWQKAQNIVTIYRNKHPQDKLYLSFNDDKLLATPKTMALISKVKGITGIFVDASSTGDKTKSEIKNWLLQYNQIAGRNGKIFGFYLGDALIESAVGWDEKDLQDFAHAKVRIWVDVYVWNNGQLRGNLITWDYPYIHAHFHLGLPGEGYYSTHEELKTQFERIAGYKTLEAIQVFAGRIPEWWINYPDWASLAIGEVTGKTYGLQDVLVIGRNYGYNTSKFADRAF